MPLPPILRPLARWRDRIRARRAMGWLLRRPDDRLLRDIGLTRDDLRRMLDAWRE